MTRADRWRYVGLPLTILAIGVVAALLMLAFHVAVGVWR